MDWIGSHYQIWNLIMNFIPGSAGTQFWLQVTEIGSQKYRGK